MQQCLFAHHDYGSVRSTHKPYGRHGPLLLEGGQLLLKLVRIMRFCKENEENIKLGGILGDVGGSGTSDL